MSWLIGSALAWPLLHLPSPADYPWIPRPPESHHMFGAGFMLVGMMMTAESLAGGVWDRNFARKMAFPTMLVFLGWGMVAVSMLEPYARLVHLSMGLPMIAGGWAEGRHRLGLMERRYADILIVPSLVLASFDTAFFHLQGSATNPIVVCHVGLVILALTIAGLRLYQSASPQSIWRSLFIAFAVLAVGLDLWVDAFFQ